MDRNIHGGHSSLATLRTLRVAVFLFVAATCVACDRGGDSTARPATRPDSHVADARRDGSDATRAANAYDVAVAQAEGAHTVAVERCDAFDGDARLACRDRADADLELAKSRARKARDSRT